MSTPTTDDMRQYFEPDGSPARPQHGDAGAHCAPPPGSAPTPDEMLFVAKLREFEDVARHRREMERLSAQHIGLQEKLNAEHAAHIARLDCHHAEVCRLLTAILQAMPNK